MLSLLQFLCINKLSIKYQLNPKSTQSNKIYAHICLIVYFSIAFSVGKMKALVWYIFDPSCEMCLDFANIFFF